MINISDGERRRAFSLWLRTGRLPPIRMPDGIELKFNPWHDPEDGRFTFAGSGQHYGPSAAGIGSAGRAERAAGREPKIVFRDDLAEPRIKTAAEADAWRAKNLAKYGADPDNRRTIEAKYRQYLASLNPAQSDAPKPLALSEHRSGEQPNRIAEFASGVGQGAFAVAKGTAEAVYSAATTNPATTISNTGLGIADMIDRAIAAENTPARVQMDRAADAVVNASARDLGHAVGSVSGNVALAAVPGMGAAKVSALRRARVVGPRQAHRLPEIGWAKENLQTTKAWKPYQDAATGARPGLAPTLTRTMPDGSKRPVKFDGVQGEYVIDRKWGIRDMAHMRAQALRQSEVLAQHGLVGTWEVPSQAVRAKAMKLLKKLNITNIKTRVVRP